MALSPTRKLGFSVLTVVLLLAGVELFLRASTHMLGVATIPADEVRAHVQAEELVADPTYGWVRKQVPDPDRHVDVHGFRTPEPFDDAKPAGTWRAFTFGDSQTYGAGVDVDESYTAVALRAIRSSRPDQPVELINTALSGYGSLQALRLIQHRVLAWDPDLLIIDCRIGDQVRDEIVAASPAHPRLDALLFRWRTYYVLRFGIERLRGRTAPMRAGAEQERHEQAGNHDQIMAVAAAAGVPVVFLDYPFWNMPSLDPRRQADMPDDEISCMAPASRLPPGAASISICQALRDSGHPARELFLDNNHMSAEGNRIAGEALAEGLLPYLPGG